METMLQDSVAQFAARKRHKITLAEARAMQAAQVFGPDADFELIDGELIFMAGDGGRTINWNAAIGRWMYDALRSRRDLVIVGDKTLALSAYSGPKPDFYVFPDAIANPEDVRGPDVLLAIEVADSTRDDDLGPKAELYAAHGVREYWVADCVDRVIHVLRLSEGGRYGQPIVVRPEEIAQSMLVPELKLDLATLTRV